MVQHEPFTTKFPVPMKSLVYILYVFALQVLPGLQAAMPEAKSVVVHGTSKSVEASLKHRRDALDAAKSGDFMAMHQALNDAVSSQNSDDTLVTVKDSRDKRVVKVTDREIGVELCTLSLRLQEEGAIESAKKVFGLARHQLQLMASGNDDDAVLCCLLQGKLYEQVDRDHGEARRAYLRALKIDKDNVDAAQALAKLDYAVAMRKQSIKEQSDLENLP